MPSKKIIAIAGATGGAILGAVLMMALTEKHTVFSFVGWTLFFVALQLPILLTSQARKYDFTRWFKK